MNQTFRSFCGTGRLGVLELGVSVADVVSVIGEPPDVYESDCDSSRVFRYGALQLRFASDSLVGINLTLVGRLPAPAELGIELPKPDSTPYDICAFLDDAQIEWEIDQRWTFDRQLCLATRAGVRFYFDIGSRELESVRLDRETLAGHAS